MENLRQCVNGIINYFAHLAEVLHDLLIGKAKHLQMMRYEEISSDRIVLFTFRSEMWAAVQLDNELCCGTVEIYNKWPNRPLPVDMMTAFPAKVKPQTLFSRCHFLAKCPSGILVTNVVRCEGKILITRIILHTEASHGISVPF